MSLLLDLADDISASILGRWIDLRAVAGLDSAVCATALRDPLLKLIRAPALEFTSFPPSGSWTTEFLRWCVHRLVKVQNMDIILQEEDAQLLTARLLAICGANLVKCDLRGPLPLRSAGEHWIVRCVSTVAIKAVAIQLHEVTVSGNTLLDALRPDRPLQTVAFRGCRLLCDEPIPLYRPCINLLKLDVCNSELTDAVLISVISHCPKLTWLNFALNVLITDATLSAVAEHLPLLETLIMRHTGITDIGVACVAAACSKLEYISLGSKDRAVCLVGDDGVRALAKGCPLLHTLDFDYAQHVADGGLLALAAHCPKLRVFVARCAFRVTDDALMTLVEGCPLLERITVPASSSVTDRSLRYIAQHCAHLVRLAYFLVPGATTAAARFVFSQHILVKYISVSK
jgi:hypothetical protein